MQRDIAKKWADDAYDDYIANMTKHDWRTLPWTGRIYNRFKKKLYIFYLRFIFDFHLEMSRIVEKMTRFNHGDRTYKAFLKKKRK